MIQNTVPWLTRHGYRCEVASWNISTHLSGRPNPVLASLATAGVPVLVVKSYGRMRLIQRAAQVAASAVRHGHRLLVSYELEGNLVALVARRLLLGRVRVMAQTHNASGIHSQVGTSPALLRLARRLYREADVMVAVSESIRRDCIDFFGLDPARVVTIYNPLPIQRIKELAAHDGDGAVEKPVGPYIVGCGRLVRMKGFSDLIEAFSRVRRKRSARLVILGEGPERATLLDQARREGVENDVVMPGFVENPWVYFSHASVFVLSSLFGEALSMVLLEAMACGVPVIATRCEWGPEEILDQGRYGLLYDPGDVDALTGHLHTMLERPDVASGYAKAGLRRAEDFSDSTILPQLEARVGALLDRAK